MANQTVTVTFQGDGIPLAIDNTTISLELGDTVEWNFQGVPSGAQVYIYFNDPPNQPFGPFAALQPFNNTVKGIGNSGEAITYSYTALVLGPENAIASSEEDGASIQNLSDEEDTVAVGVAVVQYIPEDSHPVRVRPHSLRIHGLNTVVWLIEGLPDDFFVSFTFDGFADTANGPFSSFLLSRSFGTTRFATATGVETDFLTSTAEIHYFVTVRDSTGVLKGSDDPVIEPLGSPPNP